MKWSAGFLGAALAFLFSGLLIGAFPVLWSSYDLLSLLYTFGFMRTSDAYAGNFPDPLLGGIGRILTSLSAVFFTLAALSWILKRQQH